MWSASSRRHCTTPSPAPTRTRTRRWTPRARTTRTSTSTATTATPGKGHAMKNPGGAPSYPIGDEEDLDNAIHAVGRGGADHDAIRQHVIAGAKRLGQSDKIPENWGADGSLKKAVDDEAPGSPAWEAQDAASLRTVAAQRARGRRRPPGGRSEEHTSELQSPDHLLCRLLLGKKKRPDFPASAPSRWLRARPACNARPGVLCRSPRWRPRLCSRAGIALSSRHAVATCKPPHLG